MLTCFAVPSRTGVPRKVTAMSGSRLGQNLRGCVSRISDTIPSLIRKTALGVVVKYHKYRGFPKGNA